MGVLKDIEAHILSSERIAEYLTPSASIAILDEHGLETHVLTNGPESPDTFYLADSVSKPITSVAIARLVDQGLLKFDSKIADFVDAESFLHHPESAGLIHHVTVEMLLTHTSGLIGKATCKDPSHVSGFTKGECLQFSAFPGSKWHYESDAFAVVQLLMEKVCAKPIHKLMEDLVAAPLGLERALWAPKPPLEESNYAQPHREGVQMSNRLKIRPSQLASGGMWTTPSDLLKVMLAVQKSLQGTGSFLQPATTRYMLLDGGFPRSPPPLAEFAALGWFTSSNVLAHRGGKFNGGYHSYMFGFHGSDMPGLETTSCAIMTNSIEGLGAIQALINAIMYMKRWPRQKIMLSNLAIDSAVPCHAPEGTVVDPQWVEWCGDWAIGARRGWSLFKIAEQPMFKFRDMDAVSLRPAAMPILRFDEMKSEVMLVSPELPGIAVRLTWLGDERVIELLYMIPHVFVRDLTLQDTSHTTRACLYFQQQRISNSVSEKNVSCSLSVNTCLRHATLTYNSITHSLTRKKRSFQPSKQSDKKSTLTAPTNKPKLMGTFIFPKPSASAKYIHLIHSVEGAIATDIKDFRARVVHMEPTLNYAVACAGYVEARKLLVVELQSFLDRIRQQVDGMLEGLARKETTTTEVTTKRKRGSKGTYRQPPKKRVTKASLPQKSTIRKLVLHVRRPEAKVTLRKLQEDVVRFEGLIGRLPPINDVRKSQLHEDVHESTIELVRMRWDLSRTGSFREEGLDGLR
ncbi:hypothetical protein Q7P37_010442 [Cladosporium fusiforme]